MSSPAEIQSGAPVFVAAAALEIRGPCQALILRKKPYIGLAQSL